MTDDESSINKAFANKTVLRVDSTSVNAWKFYFADGTMIEILSDIAFSGMGQDVSGIFLVDNVNVFSDLSKTAMTKEFATTQGIDVFDLPTLETKSEETKGLPTKQEPSIEELKALLIETRNGLTSAWYGSDLLKKIDDALRS